MGDDGMNGIEEFKQYCFDNIENIKPDIEQAEEIKREFIQEYPLSRIKSLSVEDYCLGTNNSKNSLSYNIEFGKYKDAGFSIGGGSSKKFGIYYAKNENCYKYGSRTIENIDEFWPKFRDNLYEFLYQSGYSDSPISMEDYPMLRGMAMVLTKFLCIYYPDKYLTIGSPSVLKRLLDYFGISYINQMRCNELNYKLFKRIKQGFPELLDHKNTTIGQLAWEFIHSKSEFNQVQADKSPGLGDQGIDEIHYWTYSPGDKAAKWVDFYEKGIMAIGWKELGDLNEYGSKNEIVQALTDINGEESSYKNSAHAVWQFVHDIKPGDIIYAKQGRTGILGKGIVESEYEYTQDYDREYPNIRRIQWIQKGRWDVSNSLAVKTLTDISVYTSIVEEIDSFFEEEKEDKPANKYPLYSREQFLKDVFIGEEYYDNLVSVLKKKKNIILQGAPGVGKTYCAKRLAYSILGKRDQDKVMMIQFHQSYSYEDFIMGFRPSKEGFKLNTGAFYDFCKEAEVDSDNEYFFIIDEINRGNLSKIFGELFMLLENDKRGKKNTVRMLYSDELFYVPENVYIIGMMNTADRSLAMLDYALRRRFSFFNLLPAFDSEGFKEYQNELSSSEFNKLIECVKQLNQAIEEDDTLGEGFCIGHSYFCQLEENFEERDLSDIVEYELIPLIKEYWFDEPEKIKKWTEVLRSSIK